MQFISSVVRILCCLPMLAQAYTGVTIVMTEQNQANQAFVAHFKQELDAIKHRTLRLSEQTLKPRSKLVVAENSELVIALGEQAFEAAVKLSHSTPVLGMLITPSKFEFLLKNSRRNFGNVSMITINQAATRQIALIRATLPNVKKIGILVGERSANDGEVLKLAAQKKDLRVMLAMVSNEADLMEKLNLLLIETDALLVMPDANVINPKTASAILFTSYRFKKPIFAYSQSLVKAGALAAVVSDTQHLAKQAAEIALAAQPANTLLPLPQEPKYYAVKVNKHVARQLNVLQVEEEELYQKILKTEILEQKSQ